MFFRSLGNFKYVKKSTTISKHMIIYNYVRFGTEFFKLTSKNIFKSGFGGSTVVRVHAKQYPILGSIPGTT